MKSHIALLVIAGLTTAGHAEELNVLAALEDGFVKVCAAVSPAVVRVTAAVKTLRRDEMYLFDRPDPFDEFNRKFFGEQRKRQDYPLGVGSGVIYNPSGLILTNEHVVSGQTEATVRLESGQVLKAKVLASDDRVDLAVLKVEAEQKLPAAQLGKAEDVRVGQFTLAFGHPFGVGEDPQPSVTRGQVSAVGRVLKPRGDHRALTNLIQTDAAINPGNSGGPLVNIRGEVIGINVAIFTMSKGNQGIAFAIPMDERIKAVVNTLSAGKQVERGYVGLRVKDITPDLAKSLGVEAQRGVLVDGVTPKGPASKAGIKKGDILLSLDGKKVDGAYELRALADGLRPGQSVEAEVLRAGKTPKLELVVGRRSRAWVQRSRYGPKAWRGMEVSQIGDPLIRKFGLKVTRGVVVTRVHPGSPAHAAGVREGAVIEKLNDRPVGTTEQFRSLTRGVGRDDALLITNNGHRLLKAEK